VRTLGLRGGAHQRHGLGVETRIVECSRCGLLFPDPFPIPVDPQELYGDPEKYFEGHDEAAKLTAYRGIVREAVARAGGGPASLLDVGSGRGEMPQAARLEGLGDVVGLEFSRAMIEYARGKYGLELVPRTIEEFQAAGPRTFDVVVLNAVLEHVYDPDSFLRAASRLTRAGGVLYLDIPRDPNLLTWAARISQRLLLRRTVLHLAPSWPPYHVYGFNPRALRTILEKHGFRIESIRVWARPRIPSGKGIPDRMKAFAGEQVMRLANLTGTASNMFVWARRRE
jgi:2-polyprenyl-3-methyl-5-hydroxy-6-metoxy-1,4-benzoquinol methylase